VEEKQLGLEIMYIVCLMHPKSREKFVVNEHMEV